MRFTERKDIPLPLIRALTDPYYSDGIKDHFENLPDRVREKYRANHISVTSLIRSPRQRILGLRKEHLIIQDPLQSYWKMFGHVIHSILERYGEVGDLVECRVGVPMKVEGVTIYLHGQVDIYSGPEGKLSDYKITKAEALAFDKSDYHRQLNILAWLMEKSGHRVRSIENIYLFRNWDSRKVSDSRPLYPKEQIYVSRVDLLGELEIDQWVRARISQHIRSLTLSDDDLPLCSEEERWVSPATHRVLRLDRNGQPQKRAKLRAGSMIEANDFIRDNSVGPKGEQINYMIETVPGASRKCEYCDVAPFCNQRQAELASMARSTANDEDDE